MKNIKYQQKAINTLCNLIEDRIEAIKNLRVSNIKNTELEKLLENIKKDSFYLVSPTGSGKTIMAFETIKKISDNQNHNILFLWIAPQTLHRQTYKKFLKNSKGTLLNIKDDNFTEINLNDVICINWDKINKDSNNLIKENENGNIFDKINKLKNKDNNTFIVTLIDEGHISGEKSKMFLQELKSDVLISISATPKGLDLLNIKQVLNKGDGVELYDNRIVKIDINEVIKEGIIKKEIIINDTKETELNFENLIKVALNKLNYLKNIYAKYNINPLMIIQMENLSKEKENIIEDILKNNGVSKNEIAIYNANEKDNIEMIDNLQSPIRVLFTKIAIATGWDCPRASVLLTYRDSEKDSFKTQVLGRICRMPELKHYEEEELNIAYVYSDIKDYIPETDSPNPPTGEKIKSILKKQYYYTIQNKDLPLYSNFLVDKLCDEINEKQLKNIIEDTFNELNIIKKENKKIYKGKITDIDEYEIENGSSVNYNHSNEEIDIIFKMAKKNNKATVFEEEYLFKVFFEKYSKDFNLNLNLEDNILNIKKILILNDIDNIFKNIINKYNQKLNEINGIQNGISLFNYFEDNNFFKFEEEIEVYKNDIKYEKSIYENIPILNNLEKSFCEYLNKKEEVECFYINNYNKNAFKIPYIENKELNYFYPDFIVWYKDGSLGLYDTKSKITSSEDIAIEKSEILYYYIKNKVKKECDGGLIILNDKKFKINRKEKYKSYKNDNNQTDWEDFE